MEPAVDIIALRKRLDWTQEQLADELGLDRSTVSRMERGKPVSGPVLKLLHALSTLPARDPADEATP